MKNSPTFKPHEDFNFESIKLGDLSRQTVERENKFEINESGRQVNELVREENEQARESAESVRVSNEEEREINEANRISKDGERDSKLEVVEGNLESKANKQQEEWIYPTVFRGSSDPSDPVAYRKDEFGVVHFKGKLDNNGSWGASAFNLPSGYRLTQTMNFIVSTYDTNETVTVRISSGRDFMYRYPYVDTSINLRGLIYYAEE